MQASAERCRGSASRRVRPLSTSTTCSSPPGPGPVSRLVYAEIGWPVALRASSRSSTARSARPGTTFSMPRHATCSRGSDVPRSALPSFVTSTSVPVSATAKFAPVIAASAARKRPRRSRRAASVSRAGSVSPGGEASSRSNSAPMSARERWIAGMMMCDGGSCASCTMRSPRSVSTTSMPWRSSSGFSPHSSVSIDLLFTTRRAPACDKSSSTTRRSSAASAAKCTRAPARCALASKRSSKRSR